MKTALFIILLSISFVSIVRPQVVSKSDFQSSMKRLWDNQSELMRSVIIYLVDDIEGSGQAIETLRKKHDEIADLFKAYYGEDSAARFRELLQSNVTFAVGYLKAIRADDIKDLEKAKQLWYLNADSIVTFLAEMNPNWNRVDLTHLMDDHLSLIIDEALARLKKDFGADFMAYNKVQEHAVELSTVLTDGIVKQFPEKFSE